MSDKETIMLLEKTKEFIEKSIFTKMIFWIITVGLLIGYFTLFFQTGIDVEDNFLRKYKNGDGVIYKGSDFWGDLKVFVTGEKNNSKTTDIIYELPGNVKRYYTVHFEDAERWYQGINKITDENGNILFQGTSQYAGNSVLLFNDDKTSGYFLGEPEITVVYSNDIKQSPYTQDYSIALRTVAGVALGTEEHTRGSFPLMIGAVLIMFLVLLDFFVPMLFFELKTAFLTDNAEPSDVYIFFQRLRWNVLPIISIGLLITALFQP